MTNVETDPESWVPTRGRLRYRAAGLFLSSGHAPHAYFPAPVAGRDAVGGQPHGIDRTSRMGGEDVQACAGVDVPGTNGSVVRCGERQPLIRAPRDAADRFGMTFER